MLWIALHLPLLSLESFAATLASDAESTAVQPLGLMDAQRIVAVNAAAQALGVKPGLKRATALALAPQLMLGRAYPMRDAQALEPVAHAALAFTPGVVIQPPHEPDAASDTVLLEVEPSLRYFGGRERLLQRLLAALHPLHHRIHVVSAPTAQAAALLARVHRHLHCPDLAAARQALDTVPVWLLRSGREHREDLQAMGLQTLADLRRLPRAGLARRFGESLLSELGRALGTEPDPRVPIVLPPVFESRLELFARADTTEQVLNGASVLLARLVTWLSAQHAFVRRFTLSMRHEARRRLDGADGPRSTTLEIALAEPSRDSAHLLVLLRERLARLQLPAPTLDLGLRADDIARRAAPNQELFATSRSEREGLTQLIERLQARLGFEQVQRMKPFEDHRPECEGRLEAAAGAQPASRIVLVQEPASPASHTRSSSTPTSPAAALKPRRRKTSPAATPMTKPPTKPGTKPGTKPATEPTTKPKAAPPVTRSHRQTPRPVWLLQKPEPLPEHQSRPLLGGEPLQLLSGPERIEAGWWDTALAERDYFIAQAADGALVWIYRARLPLSAAEGQQGWFMQGRFG